MPPHPVGVNTLSKSGSAKLKGDVTLSQGSNVTLTESGQDISIAASGGAPDVYENGSSVVAAATRLDFKDFNVENPSGTLADIYEDLAGLCQGRLTLTSGTAITTSDVTGATSIYWTPFKGDKVSLFDGTRWKKYTFTELTFSVGTLVNAQGYDLFLYDNAGVLTLESAEWANAAVTMTIASPCVVTWTAHGMATGNSITFTTSGALPTGVSANTQYWITKVDANTFKLSTSLANVAAGTFINTSGSQSGTHTGHQPKARQTALVLQNGIEVKSGGTTRRYLGSFMTTATTTTEDSKANRFLWNRYNQDNRPLYYTVSSTHSYNSGTERPWNNDGANRCNFFVGLSTSVTGGLDGTVVAGTAGNNAYIGIGTDSATVIDQTYGIHLNYNANYTQAGVFGVSHQTPGHHFLLAMEAGSVLAGNASFTHVSVHGFVPG